jgi:hypothetical protein
VTVSDETGWEFETKKRIYANFGVDSDGRTTATAWNIVKLSPESSALRAEETRREKIDFAVEPRDGRQFTIKATLRYRYAPPANDDPGSEGDAETMAETALTLAGKRPA